MVVHKGAKKDLVIMSYNYAHTRNRNEADRIAKRLRRDGFKYVRVRPSQVLGVKMGYHVTYGRLV